MPTQLTMIIPGLQGPANHAPQEIGADRPLRAMETLLSRADRSSGGAGPLESLLFNAFGHVTGDADLPVAAVTKAVDMMDIDGGGWWLRADPVHLDADRDTLVFRDSAGLGLSDQEAAQLVRELDQVFLPRGWHLHMGAAQRWYLRLPDDPRMHTRMPSLMMGQDIRPHLPRGEQAALWHMVMNEAQMQLHMSPVNHRREALGLPVVNSVWIWGGGYTPRSRAPWDHLWCNHVVGRGLARLNDGDIMYHPVPDHGDDWLTQSASGGFHLVVLETVDTDDPQQWRSGLQGVNDRWIVPALAAIKAGTLDRLTLVTGNGTDFTLTPSASKRWWRRTKKLHDSFLA